MITQTDSLNTIEFEKYFVILPSTNLWDIQKFKNESSVKPGKECAFGFSYDSGKNDHFLSVNELKMLIQKMS
jgi:UDP-N-acetylglucosamine 4,6-dehydratase/5-epimerase